IYNHFGGKEGIAKALYHHLIGELEEMMQEVMAEQVSHRERCNRIIQLLFEYTETRRNIVAYMLHGKHREFLSDEPPLCSATPFIAMRDIVDRGMECGEIRRGDPWVIASAVFGGAIRMIHLRLDGVIEGPLMVHYDELIDCTRGGLQAVQGPISNGV
ncbi:TetR/AcrR family transcriptional regulator, partial [Endothiovibrio diazotrophicus]